MKNRIIAAFNCLRGRPTIYNVKFMDAIILNRIHCEYINIIDCHVDNYYGRKNVAPISFVASKLKVVSLIPIVEPTKSVTGRD